MKRFEKAKEIVQSDQFGNVIDFFTAVRDTNNEPAPFVPSTPVIMPKQTPDYTPLMIMGAIAVLVALIKK